MSDAMTWKNTQAKIREQESMQEQHLKLQQVAEVAELTDRYQQALQVSKLAHA